MEPKLTKNEKKAIRQEEARDKEVRENRNRLYKTIAFWGLGGVLLVLALWALVAFSSGTTTSSSGPTLVAPKVTTSDYQSNPGGKVTLTEYADFQCPACKAYFPIIQQLQQQFGKDLNVVYRFFPLKTIHQNAVNSAKAAYAAGKQNAFWPMHDKLFTTQSDWENVANPESLYVGYAKSIGINTDQFKKDYEASSTEDFVNKAYNDDTALGLNSTPTFFINNKQIDNPQSLDDFKTVISNAMK